MQKVEAILAFGAFAARHSAQGAVAELEAPFGQVPSCPELSRAELELSGGLECIGMEI